MERSSDTWKASLERFSGSQDEGLVVPSAVADEDLAGRAVAEDLRRAAVASATGSANAEYLEDVVQFPDLEG